MVPAILAANSPTLGQGVRPDGLKLGHRLVRKVGREAGINAPLVL
jgi:hypothetical protein